MTAPAYTATLTPFALGRHTIAVLWRRGRDHGDVSVLLGDRLVPVASVELMPAREQVAA